MRTLNSTSYANMSSGKADIQKIISIIEVLKCLIMVMGAGLAKSSQNIILNNLAVLGPSEPLKNGSPGHY